VTDTHARYSPSKLPNLALCPGWQSDPTPGPAAMRGTAIHGILAEIVNGKEPAIPADLVEPVEAGRRILTDLRAEFPDLEWHAEIKAETGIAECHGTADLVGVSEWTDVAVVADWKSGRGERDEAGTNLQAIAYALGILRRWPHLRRIVCILAELEQQPTRCEWTVDQLTVAQAVIQRTIEAAESATPDQYQPSAKACQYCNRRGGCPAQAKSMQQTAAETRTLADRGVADLTGPAVSNLLKMYRDKSEIIAKFIKDLESRAKELLTADPASVPGYELKEKAGAREWTAPESVVVDALRHWSANHGSVADNLSAYTLASPSEMERRMIAVMGGAKGAKQVVAKELSGLSKNKASMQLVEAGS
jgi:hypothetical protein